jgi:hypothetical protein
MNFPRYFAFFVWRPSPKKEYPGMKSHPFSDVAFSDRSLLSFLPVAACGRFSSLVISSALSDERLM